MSKFYKVTDVEGKIFTLAKVDQTHEGDVVTLAEHSSAEGKTTLRSVDSFNQRDFTGLTTQITEDEFEESLNAWGYDPSVSVKADEPAAETSDTVANANAEAAGSTLGNDAVNSEGGELSQTQADQSDTSESSGSDTAKADEAAA